MKKLIIGSLVGAIILFVWSAMSWTMLPINLHTFMYTPAQDSILKVLADNNVPTGTYGIPMVDNRNVSGFDSKYQEDSEKLMKEKAGTPMATLFYQREDTQMGAATFMRGLLFDFLAVLAACIILIPGFVASTSFLQRWWLVMVVGLLITASGPLIEYNWMGRPWDYAMHMVTNDLLNWGITGIWLAWYFRKA